MKKAIVSIISDQTIPNYIFIKEKYQEVDELLFISSKKMENKISWITSALADINLPITKIILESGVEEQWGHMCNEISKNLSLDYIYLVNLTGGTKYMSMAIQTIFKSFNSEFYYIPFPKNEILTPENQIDTSSPLKYRVNIREYMSLHNVVFTQKDSCKEEDYTKVFFNLFVNNKFDQTEKDCINSLRSYRNFKKLGKTIYNAKKVEINLIKSGIKDCPPTNEIDNFLEKIDFPYQEQGYLYQKEIEYLTGGWFEEYIFNLIKREINPTDITLGVNIQQTEHANQNDLDVVFTLGNKLFVIECKTAISKIGEQGEESLFKEISYKAATIKATLLGLPGNSFICALSEGNDRFKQTAYKMGITYFDKSYFIEPNKSNEFISFINNLAKER